MKQAKNILKVMSLAFLAISMNVVAHDDEHKAVDVIKSTTSAHQALQETIATSKTPKNSELVAERLQQILANHYVLYTKTQKYHWNVEGKHFNDLHAFFGKLYTAQQANIDLIAERIRALGFKVASTLQQFSSMATLTEQTNDKLDEQGMIASLLNDYQILIVQLNKDLVFAIEHGDAATNNFLTDLVFQYEKSVWMLKALLNK